MWPAVWPGTSSTWKSQAEHVDRVALDSGVNGAGTVSAAGPQTAAPVAACMRATPPTWIGGGA
jgi:hypothetical protein